jgi:GTP cyclohydrolase I
MSSNPATIRLEDSRMNMPVETLADPIAEHARAMLAHLGEDPGRPGLAETPSRFAKALRFLTGGYEVEPADVVGGGVFPAEGEGLVVVRDVEFHSLCEHHILPFFGRVHVAYLPGERIIGLSKLARVVEMFSRDLQVQERLTVQIARWLDDHLAPGGVGVVLEAEQLCMALRGVRKPGSRTVTSALHGLVRDDARTRAEFLALTTERSR